MAEQAKESLPTTNIDVGLSGSDVEKLREKWGWNEIPTPSTPTYILFLRQFTGFLQIIILIAAIVAIAVVDYPDFIVIVAMLLVNGTCEGIVSIYVWYILSVFLQLMHPSLYYNRSQYLFLHWIDELIDRSIIHYCQTLLIF